MERVEKLVSVCEARNESMVMEGVHLSMNAIVKIMAKHPSVLPFLVYISNEAKHRERFAVSIQAILQPWTCAAWCKAKKNNTPEPMGIASQTMEFSQQTAGKKR